MNQERLECAYHLCSRKPLESSKDGHCIFHARAKEKTVREFHEAFRNYIKEIEAGTSPYNFKEFIFVGGFDFRPDFGTSILKGADFAGAEFHGVANFDAVEFQRGVLFTDAKFYDVASFRRAKFGPVSFLQAKFYGVADFRSAEFQLLVDFIWVDFQAKTYISPKSITGKILFIDTILENVFLTPLNLDKNAWVDFTRARLRNTEVRYEDIKGHIRQEQKKNFAEAKEIYILLKNNFHSIGRYNDESWAFKKEKDMERKSYYHTESFPKPKWLCSWFFNLFYGYGERPFSIFGWCGFLLLFCSFIYWLSKGVFQVMGTCLLPVESYWNNLYFSVVTFSTLGYGDFRPIGKIRVLASIEALLGIFFIALFIFTFARKTGGR